VLVRFRRLVFTAVLSAREFVRMMTLARTPQCYRTGCEHERGSAKKQSHADGTYRRIREARNKEKPPLLSTNVERRAR
jgi:hypothetical protein